MSEKIKNLRFNAKDASEFFAKNLAYTLGPVELKEMMTENEIKLIDVRAKEDFDISHLPNAINVPYADLKLELNSNTNIFSKEVINVVYCYNHLCHLADRAAYKLAESDYPVMVMQGGFKSWTEEFHFAVVSK